MKKHFLIAATAALLVLPNLSSSVLAAPPDAFEDAGPHHPQFSPDDFAAFTDARIAALKVGLKLTPAQEKNWPALEAALRDQAKARAARIAEWREKANEPREHRSVIEGLQRGAKRLAARSAELEKLADAAKPLYDSLDDAQKARFRPLLHIATGKHWHHEHDGFRHG
jgi:LTXXQ motif family protein